MFALQWSVFCAAFVSLVLCRHSRPSTFSWGKLNEHRRHLKRHRYSQVADFTYKVLRPHETDEPSDACDDLRIKVWVCAHMKRGKNGKAVLTIVRTDNVLNVQPMRAKGTRCALDDEWLDVAGWPAPLKVVLCSASDSSNCTEIHIPENRAHDVMQLRLPRNNVLSHVPKRSQEIPRRIIRVTHDSAEKRVAVLDKIGVLLALQNPAYALHEYHLDELDARARSLDGLAVNGQATTVGTQAAEAMRRLQPVAYRVDVFRVAELYVCGGVYMDSKVLPMRPLEALLPAAGGIFPFDCDPVAIWNGLMAFPAGDALLLEVLRRIAANIDRRHYGHSTLEPTGPLVVGGAWREHFKGQSDRYRHELQLASHGVFIWDYRTRERLVVVHNPEYRRHFLLSNACHYTQLFRSRAVYYEAACDPRYGLPWNTRLGAWDVRVRTIAAVCAALCAVCVLLLAIIKRSETRRRPRLDYEPVPTHPPSGSIQSPPHDSQ